MSTTPTTPAAPATTTATTATTAQTDPRTGQRRALPRGTAVRLRPGALFSRFARADEADMESDAEPVGVIIQAGRPLDPRDGFCYKIRWPLLIAERLPPAFGGHTWNYSDEIEVVSTADTRGA